MVRTRPTPPLSRATDRARLRLQGLPQRLSAALPCRAGRWLFRPRLGRRRRLFRAHPPLLSEPVQIRILSSPVDAPSAAKHTGRARVSATESARKPPPLQLRTAVAGSLRTRATALPATTTARRTRCARACPARASGRPVRSRRGGSRPRRWPRPANTPSSPAKTHFRPPRREFSFFFFLSAGTVVVVAVGCGCCCLLFAACSFAPITALADQQRPSAGTS